MTKGVLTQDNEPFTFTTLGAATLNVVRWLESSKDHQRDGERQTPGERSEKQNPDDRAEAIKDGLRRIQRFEDGYRRGDRARR